MRTPDIKKVATPTVKSLVSSYLMLKFLASVMREQVDAIYADVLRENPVYEDRTKKQIYLEQHLYLCPDDKAVQNIWDIAGKRLTEAGIKPADMDKEKCPALVAEHDLVKIEWLLIDEDGKPFGLSCNKMYNIEHRAEFIRLITGLIMGLLDFKNPITGG